MSNSKKTSVELVKIMVNQWEVMKRDLYNGKTEGKTLEELKTQYLFLDRFDQVLNGSLPFFDVSLDEVGTMYRGVGVNEDIDLKNFSRLIPSLDFAKYHNRMNPPGKAFIYLGIVSKKLKFIENEKETVLKTIEAELRATEGDYYTKACFEATNAIKIFDMTGNSELPMDFNEFAEVLFYNFSKFPMYMAQYYFNLFNHENIFKPINNNNQEEKAREYAPFQLLARYIQSKGYGGIKFRSTVHKEGTNLVIFNVNNVKLIESSLERINL